MIENKIKQLVNSANELFLLSILRVKNWEEKCHIVFWFF